MSLFIPGIIMTKNSNPEVMAICYAQGWTDSEDYMTEREASAVSDISTYFEKVNMKTFTELKYFINISQISYGAFRDCSKLESITLPESITSIGGMLSGACSSLKSITVPEGVSIINDSTFSYCSKLESITLPESTTSIGGDAFRSLLFIKINHNSKECNQYRQICILRLLFIHINFFAPKFNYSKRIAFLQLQ
ncbi:leucine-rich repeat domain-containing protein [Bacteroides salyersiae]|nr:leucine-rich repeat domain-containing protein [Bacteroides salyersiae]